MYEGRGKDPWYPLLHGQEEEGADECKPFRVGRDTEEDTEYDAPWGEDACRGRY